MLLKVLVLEIFVKSAWILIEFHEIFTLNFIEFFRNSCTYGGKTSIFTIFSSISREQKVICTFFVKWSQHWGLNTHTENKKKWCCNIFQNGGKNVWISKIDIFFFYGLALFLLLNDHMKKCLFWSINMWFFLTFDLFLTFYLLFEILSFLLTYFVEFFIFPIFEFLMPLLFLTFFFYFMKKRMWLVSDSHLEQRHISFLCIRNKSNPLRGRNQLQQR